DADGSQRSILFSDPERNALGPAWSPQGDRIAFGIGTFFQGMTGPSKGDIAMMQADGTGIQMLTDGSGNYGFPSWSPDGRRLVFRGAGNERNGLFIVDIETRAV